MTVSSKECSTCSNKKYDRIASTTVVTPDVTSPHYNHTISVSSLSSKSIKVRWRNCRCKWDRSHRYCVYLFAKWEEVRKLIFIHCCHVVFGCFKRYWRNSRPWTRWPIQRSIISLNSIQLRSYQLEDVWVPACIPQLTLSPEQNHIRWLWWHTIQRSKQQASLLVLEWNQP